MDHLRFRPNGIAHWDEVEVGGYVLVRLPFGALGNHDLVLRKRSDGTATVLLHPDGEPLAKSARLFSTNALTVGKPTGPLLVFPTDGVVALEKASQATPLHLAPTIAHAEKGYRPQLIGGSTALSGDPTTVQARDGVYRLPEGEREQANEYRGTPSLYPSLRLRPYADEAERYAAMHDGPSPAHFAGLSHRDAVDGLASELTRHGAVQSHLPGYDLAMPLPTGHRVHIALGHDNPQTPQGHDFASIRRRDGDTPFAAHYAGLPTALAQPGQMWEAREGDGTPRWSLFGFPRTSRHDSALNRHFPGGMVSVLHPAHGGDAGDLALTDVVSGAERAHEAHHDNEYRQLVHDRLDQHRYGALRYVNHPLGGV